MAYRETGSIAAAARSAGVHRTQHYYWLQDPDYAKAFKATEEEAGQVIEDEAVRRAVEGVLKPVYYQGEVVGRIREYSDTLLLALLRRFRPDMYRETTQQANVNTTFITLEARIDAARERMTRSADIERLITAPVGGGDAAPAVLTPEVTL